VYPTGLAENYSGGQGLILHALGRTRSAPTDSKKCFIKLHQGMFAKGNVPFTSAEVLTGTARQRMCRFPNDDERPVMLTEEDIPLRRGGPRPP